MPRIPEAVIENVRERADIVEIATSLLRLALHRRGSDYWACCPFHQEKTPSFKISSRYQSFYCFGCHKSGNVFSLVQGLENLDFVEAVRWLARHLGIVIPEPEVEGGPAEREAVEKQRQEREQGFQLLAQMARWYQHRLTLPDAQVARDYVAGRGLDAEAVAAFAIGYAPDSWDAALRWSEQLGFARDLMVRTGLVSVREEDPSRCYDRFRGRLMFPIWDDHGRVVGFSGRVLEADAKTAKYVNSPETEFFHKGRLLYAFHVARAHFPEHHGALVCEGQLDVIACHRAGLNHAVCSQGTAFTEQHVQLLRRAADAVTLAFDADAAGEKAAVATVQLLQRAGLVVSVAVLPPGEDPDSLFRHKGPQALREAMTKAVDAVQFVYGLASRTHDPATPMGKAAIVDETMPVVISLQNPVARSAYCTWMAERLGVPPTAVARTMEARLQEETRPRAGDRSGRGVSPAGAGSGPTAALPAFEAPVARDPAVSSLLDLAVHFDSVAQELLEELPAELVPATPVGEALNLVLAATSAGEWSRAGVALTARQDLVGCPEVARVLAESAYAKLDPESVPEPRRSELRLRLHRAAADCVARRRLDDLKAQARQKAQQLAAEPDQDRQTELLQQHRALQARKREIRAGPRPAASRPPAPLPPAEAPAPPPA